MAGAGYNLFNTGDVLTAAQVNEYLMQQTVMVFANATARTTALSGVLAEGMISYLKDTNAVERYDGSTWSAIGAGDIEGVTAGTGMSGGGTSGTVTLTNDMATTITASGDIVVGTGNATYDNLPIGTTGQVLTADTTVSPYKVKWASVSASPASSVATVATQQTTTNSSYTDLTTAGPSVTLTTGTKALVIMSCLLGSQNSLSEAMFACNISGASSVSPSDAKAGLFVSEPAYVNHRMSIATLFTGLTAGSNTFKMQYKSPGSQVCYFSNREIVVIDMGS